MEREAYQFKVGDTINNRYKSEFKILYIFPDGTWAIESLSGGQKFLIDTETQSAWSLAPIKYKRHLIIHKINNNSLLEEKYFLTVVEELKHYIAQNFRYSKIVAVKEIEFYEGEGLDLLD